MRQSLKNPPKPLSLMTSAAAKTPYNIGAAGKNPTYTQELVVVPKDLFDDKIINAAPKQHKRGGEIDFSIFLFGDKGGEEG